MKRVALELTREEALATLGVLENIKRPFGWQQKALRKLVKAMGLKPKESKA